MEKSEWWSILKTIAESSKFWRHLGMTIERIDDGFARLRLAGSESLINAGGVLHGGAVASVADSAVAIASLSLCSPNERVSTIEMKINYLVPAKPGDCFCEARIVRKGQTTAVGDVEVFDCNGTMVAKGLMTYAIMVPDARDDAADAGRKGYRPDRADS